MNITTAAEAAQKLGDISSDEGVNDGNDKGNKIIPLDYCLKGF